MIYGALKRMGAEKVQAVTEDSRKFFKALVNDEKP